MTDTTTVRVTGGATIAKVTGGSTKSVATGSITVLKATQGVPGPAQVDVLTTKGDVLTHDGSDTVRIGVGTNGQIIQANSATVEGIEWVDPPATSPLTTKGDLYTFDTDNQRLPVGLNGQFLRANSATVTGLDWQHLAVGDLPPHASTHENGGSDEISVGGLSGLLADPQTPLGHAATHLPAGSDPLTTAAAVEVTDSSNAEGTAQSFARSDHTHAHGNRSGGLLHAVATVALAGFMSAADKTKLDGLPASAVPTTRTLTAGGGLTGGGDLSADRTFDVGANADGSIVVNPNDIQVGVLATDAQHGNRGGGALHADATTLVAGFMSAADKTKLDGLPASAVPPIRVLTAGAGLTGGGDLSADRTFDVVANADGSIVVNANDIQVGVLANDAQHGNLGGGGLHAVTTGAVAGFMSAADKTKLDTYPASFPFAHSALSGLGAPADDHTQYFLLGGRAGGQSALGGTAAADSLTLTANTINTGAGRINVNTPMIFGPYSGITGAAYGLSYTATENFTAGFVGGGLNFSGTITFNSTTFIYESFRGSPIINTAANAGFQAYTVLQALPSLRSGSLAGHNPLPTLVFNAGPAIYHANTGTRTTPFASAINWAPNVTTPVANGQTLNVTNTTGLINAPKFSTASGTTINFGTIRAVHCQIPGPAFFGSSAGTEMMTGGYIGLDFDNMAAFGGNVLKVAVRSSQAAASNAYFLQHTGTAQSVLGGQLRFPSDLTGVTWGAGDDIQAAWDGAGFWFWQFNATGDQLRWSNAAGQRYILQTENGDGDGELNQGFLKQSFGQVGSVGNQKFAFVSGAETITVGGDYSGMLWTYSANDTINAAIGTYATATWNAGNPTIGTGSLVTNTIMLIGGNPGGAATNRVGIQIISNPSGGAGVNAALWVTAGLAQFDGAVRIGGATTDLVGFYGNAGAAQAAAYTVTNQVVRRTFDTTLVTVQQLAEVVGTLIADDQATGYRA